MPRRGEVDSKRLNSLLLFRYVVKLYACKETFPTHPPVYFFSDSGLGRGTLYTSFRVQELCESRGGRPGLSVLTSLLVPVDVKLY